MSVHVFGLVQGVSFRAACQQEAERLGVRGWVSNEPDESVTGLFEGSRDAVDRLVAWCRSGPPGAEVDRVDVEEAGPSGESGFETH